MRNISRRPSRLTTTKPGERSHRRLRPRLPLIPNATDWAPDRGDQLQEVVTRLRALAGAAASQVRTQLAVSTIAPNSEDEPAKRARVIAAVFSAAAAGRFAEARTARTRAGMVHLAAAGLLDGQLNKIIRSGSYCAQVVPGAVGSGGIERVRSDAARQADLDSITNQVPRLRVSFLYQLDPAVFQAATEALAADLPSLTDAEFLRPPGGTHRFGGRSACRDLRRCDWVPAVPAPLRLAG